MPSHQAQPTLIKPSAGTCGCCLQDAAQGNESQRIIKVGNDHKGHPTQPSTHAHQTHVPLCTNAETVEVFCKNIRTGVRTATPVVSRTTVTQQTPI